MLRFFNRSASPDVQKSAEPAVTSSQSVWTAQPFYQYRLASPIVVYESGAGISETRLKSPDILPNLLQTIAQQGDQLLGRDKDPFNQLSPLSIYVDATGLETNAEGQTRTRVIEKAAVLRLFDLESSVPDMRFAHDVPDTDADLAGQVVDMKAFRESKNSYVNQGLKYVHDFMLELKNHNTESMPYFSRGSQIYLRDKKDTSPDQTPFLIALR